MLRVRLILISHFSGCDYEAEWTCLGLLQVNHGGGGGGSDEAGAGAERAAVRCAASHQSPALLSASPPPPACLLPGADAGRRPLPACQPCHARCTCWPTVGAVQLWISLKIAIILQFYPCVFVLTAFYIIDIKTMKLGISISQSSHSLLWRQLLNSLASSPWTLWGSRLKWFSPFFVECLAFLIELGPLGGMCRASTFEGAPQVTSLPHLLTGDGEIGHLWSDSC